MNFEILEKEIDYKFNDINLLKNALTHTSYANEKSVLSNERLEFLGDAVLELTMSEYLYKNYFNFPEGEMTKVRASVVCEESLNKIAIKHNFGDFLFLGKCEEITGGRNRASLLADSVEAVIGAIYLDGGYENSKKFILSNLVQAVQNSVSGTGVNDYKTSLQEILQKNGEVKIKYEIISEEGPAHDKKFTAIVTCNGKLLGTGTGKSKKEAEQAAAKVAIENER